MGLKMGKNSSLEKYFDPVCMMEVDSSDESVLKFIYKTNTYYFCAEKCRKAFEVNPENYLNPKSRKRKGLWGRYLERLEKATGGKAQKCH